MQGISTSGNFNLTNLWWGSNDNHFTFVYRTWRNREQFWRVKHSVCGTEFSIEDQRAKGYIQRKQTIPCPLAACRKNVLTKV
jgi:hypothetical protein